MSKKFVKRNGMSLRKTRCGWTMYSTVTVSDEMLRAALEVQSRRSGKAISKCLGQFIQDAFDAGLTPGIVRSSNSAN